MREIKIVHVANYDDCDDVMVLQVGDKYLNILVPKDDSGWFSNVFQDSPESPPFGLNMVCRGHYT